jgi:hypothetical protein
MRFNQGLHLQLLRNKYDEKIKNEMEDNMNDITGYTFFKSYHECLIELDIEDKKDILNAIDNYIFEDIEPTFTGIKKAIWIATLPNLNTSKIRSKARKSKENQNEIKMKSKCELSPPYPYPYPNPLIKLGNYKRVVLTNKQYEKLIKDYNKEFIDNQINLLDEYIQSNNNKNKYTDFNLVLRKSIRENWFKDNLKKDKPQKEVPEWFDKNIENEVNIEATKEMDNLLEKFN